VARAAGLSLRPLGPVRPEVGLKVVGPGEALVAECAVVAPVLPRTVDRLVLPDRRLRREALAAGGAEEGPRALRVLPLRVRRQGRGRVESLSTVCAAVGPSPAVDPKVGPKRNLQCMKCSTMQ
jgi:hypothetical protein